MRHRFLLTAKILIATLCTMVLANSVAAQSITDLSYKLGTLSEPQLLEDWAAHGDGTRAGIRVTTAAGMTRTYTHSSLTLDGVAFLMDVLVSAEILTADENRGVSMWVRFSAATLPPGLVHHAEVRLYRETGTYKVGLFNTDGAGTALASFSQDWTNAVDRLRIRIRYQEVAGVGTIFLVAENSSQWAPDLTEPLNPGPGNTLSLPVNGANFPGVAASGEFGFGNSVPGQYYADYESVRLMRSSEPGTVLPVSSVASIPVLGISAYAALVILLAIAGWVFLRRE